MDEKQIKDLIDRSANKGEILLGCVKHLKILTLMMKKLTLETDSLTNEIRQKAEEDAQTQAQAILDRARQQAVDLIEQKRIEAEALAQKAAEVITNDALAAAQKCIREAEQEADFRAKAIIMRALVDGNTLIEQKRIDADLSVLKQLDGGTTGILPDAQRCLKEAEVFVEMRT